MGGQVSKSHTPASKEAQASVPGTFLSGSLWGTWGLCGVPRGPSLWTKSIPLPSAENPIPKSC